MLRPNRIVDEGITVYFIGLLSPRDNLTMSKNVPFDPRLSSITSPTVKDLSCKLLERKFLVMLDKCQWVRGRGTSPEGSNIVLQGCKAAANRV